MEKTLTLKKAKGSFKVRNDRGLHTRPSTEIVKCATDYKSEIHLFAQKGKANAKSLLGILMMAATKGTKVKIEAEGVDAEEAVNSLLALAEKDFLMKY